MEGGGLERSREDTSHIPSLTQSRGFHKCHKTACGKIKKGDTISITFRGSFSNRKGKARHASELSAVLSLL